MSSEHNNKYNLPLIKRMSVVELRNAIWSMKNGTVAVGGYPIEVYENELFLRIGIKNGYHEMEDQLLTHDIGAFSKEKAEKIKENLNGKTYMNFNVLVYPLGGEWHVLLSTEYIVSKEEFFEFLIFFLASQLD